MKLTEYANCDAIELSRLIKQGEVSKDEVTGLADKAIRKMDSQLNFMAYSLSETERSSLNNSTDAPFDSVPFLIKEGTSVSGLPWNAASRLAVGRVAEADDEVCRRFRKSGVTLMGLSTSPEMANAPTTESVLHGPTRNPWKKDCMPGGSSGGAAAAVASGAVPIAHATDGGGSIRIPAACCGLVGLKPTRARTPGYQCMPYSLAVSHVVSRSVRDSAAMLDYTHGPETGAVYHVNTPCRPYLDEVKIEPKGLRIAYSTNSPSGAKLDADCVRGVEDAARLCDSLGHHVEEADLPYAWEPMCEAFTDLWSYKHPFSVAQIIKATGLQSGPDTRESCNLAMLAHAQNMTMFQFEKSLQNLDEACRSIGRFFQGYDIFISPVTTRPAIKLGELDANAADLTASLWVDRMISNYALFTPVFNATGQPSISLPLYKTLSGLPIGVQFAARHGDESTLFNLAGQLEREIPWRSRKPEISIF